MNEATPRLTRALLDLPSAPVRIVHLGLGNFHRAHQAWHTHKAPDAHDWGIAAFTGRRPDMARALAPQDGLYTLITRESSGDTFDVVRSIVAVHASDEHEAFLGYLRRAEVAIVTMTLTEHAYLRNEEGGLDSSLAEVTADVEALKDGRPVQTLPGRLLAGLLARRSAEAGPITLLSCDNLPENGDVTRRIVTDLAGIAAPEALDWIKQNVDFATSMVDRITPATTDEDIALVAREQGYDDVSPVPTEPFSEWVVSGTFPAGRPTWEAAGVQLAPDVAPHERRKLWLLNGSHSLLAYTGPLLGHRTIDEAIADARCLEWVNAFWDEAQRNLGLSDDLVGQYRQDLLERYGNTGVRHHLAQIAYDGSQKLPVRTLPTVLAERAAGRLPAGAATTLAGWVLHLRGQGAPVQDAGAGAAQEAAGAQDLAEAVAGVLNTLRAGLGQDAELVSLVVERVQYLQGLVA
ncbi:mannitol dehydrogenase family protein [Pseudactinotalea sp. Z1748]|uniref:mannitol dehydrogenase family protein n=1 Tax=Pseudactinotalea sp. Z1748 TaxID=3413027 RepID=UPI003C7C05C0